MIEIKSLSKRFGAFTAVDNISFQVGRGEVLGFLGPNGAGKSTTMKMVTGYLTPTSGTAVVAGFDVLNNPLAVKERIGYLPEGAPAYPDMTPASFLNFVADIRGMHGSARRKRIEHVAATVHLEGVMRQSIDTLSKGYKRRVGLAQAILHDPDVLIMDEPTDGLDPNQKHEVRLLIQAMAKEKAIVLSTHILEEVEAICTRAIIISRGKIVADGTPESLRARSRHHNAVWMRVSGTPDRAAAMAEEARRLPSVAAVEQAPGMNGSIGLMIFPKHGGAIAPDLAAHARARGWALEEMRIEPGRLDDVFRSLTAPALAAREVKP